MTFGGTNWIGFKTDLKNWMRSCSGKCILLYIIFYKAKFYIRLLENQGTESWRYRIFTEVNLEKKAKNKILLLIITKLS